MRTSTTLASVCFIAGTGCSQGIDSVAGNLATARDNFGSPSDGTLAGDSPVPAPLAERLADLNACKSRLQDTHATLSAQLIQGEDGPVFLYVYYLIV